MYTYIVFHAAGLGLALLSKVVPAAMLSQHLMVFNGIARMGAASWTQQALEWVKDIH